jgi:hypothetical protein
MFTDYVPFFSVTPRAVGENFIFSARKTGTINQYPDVLTEKLGLTHLTEYEIQLLENTSVRLAPYRLDPPKMQSLREHINKLLRDGVIEP